MSENENESLKFVFHRAKHMVQLKTKENKVSEQHQATRRGYVLCMSENGGSHKIAKCGGQ